ncbi:MAG: hypothetical protein ICV55_15395 [Coleofasciculus sp. C3-bin4]|nr:hypothetical protein [Coleofasciculus sp. C3-bin4]
MFQRGCSVSFVAVSPTGIEHYRSPLALATKISPILYIGLVQSYIEARSLQEWIQDGCRFNEAELTAIVKALLDILEYLHRLHPPVIHRDIKPSNVLLRNRSGNSPGEVYLIDFGSVQTTTQRQLWVFST